MKNTLFAATYYNAPHFIQLQMKTFEHYIRDSWDFTVLSDADQNATSVLTGRPAKQEIIDECARLNVRHIEIPQSVHGFVEHGGLVVNDAPGINLGHLTERHQSTLRWIFNSYKQLGFDQYKYFVLLDADMFWRQPTNISEYMNGIDMMGAARQQTINISSLPPDRQAIVPEDVKAHDGLNLNFFTMCLLFVNMQTVKNLETLDNRSFRVITDTGGRSHYFIQSNPQYNYYFMKDWNSQDYRVDFFSKNPPRNERGEENESEIIHYRAGGSNWENQSKEYYLEKLHRMMKKFIPELHQAEWDQHLTHDVHDSRGYHTFHKGR